MVEHQLEEQLHKAEIVCVDYFDTLVHRCVSEKDVKRLWAMRLSEQLLTRGIDIQPRELLQVRGMAETAVSTYSTYKNEAPYELLMKCMHSYILEKCKMKQSEFERLSLGCEIQVELNCQKVDESGFEILQWAKENKKRVYIVSDFYLPVSAFCKFLKCHTLESYIDDIFVSSECDARKSNGTMYEHLRKHLLKEQKTIMIGDHAISDVEQAKKYQFMTWHKEYNSTASTKEVDDIKKQLKKIAKEKKVPFVNYAFVLYLFVEKLFRVFHKNNAKKVYFLSREGEFLKQIFEHYQDKKTFFESVETEYLYVSRAALAHAGEEKMGLQKYLESVGFFDQETVYLVDIGWKGTMQDMLKEMFPEKNIKGYYLGLTNKAVRDLDNDKEGLVFSFWHQKSIGYDGYLFDNFMQEKLLMASHGTATDYTLEGQVELEQNEEEQSIYRFLEEWRSEVFHKVDEIFGVLQSSGFMLKEFNEFCLKTYLDEMLCRRRTYNHIRKKIMSEDKIVFKEEENCLLSEKRAVYRQPTKLKRMRRQLGILKREQASLISYYAVLRPYFQKIKLGFLWDVVGKIAKRKEIKLVHRK